VPTCNKVLDVQHIELLSEGGRYPMENVICVSERITAPAPRDHHRWKTTSTL